MMPWKTLADIVGLPGRGLAFLGRHGRTAFALSVVLGLALPQLAATLRPVLPISIFCFIMLSFARADAAGVRRTLVAPGRLALVVVTSTLIPVVVASLAMAALGPGLDPELRLGIALMAAAPPLMASPAYAALLGFDNSLALAMVVLGMALAPLISPGLASLLAGAAVPIDPAVLGVRLLVFIGGGCLAGLLLRRLAGIDRLVRRRHELDGLGVVLFFLFAIAAMDGVIVATLAAPLRTLGYLALASLTGAAALAMALACGGALAPGHRFTFSIGIGLRNMGLLIAALGPHVPPGTYLYFALAQIPIYFAPLTLGWVSVWINRWDRPPGAHTPIARKDREC